MAARAARLIAQGALVAVVLCVGMTRDLPAQEATPEIVVPRPDECTVEPRTPPLFGGIPATPVATTPVAQATPTALPEGEPADQVVIDGVTRTVRESVACRNAGDFARAYALLSDDMLRHLFGQETLIPPEVQALLADRQRVSKSARLAIVSLSDFTIYPDGRASAVVVTENTAHVFRDQLLLVNTDDRWLIDAVIASQVTARE